MGVVTAVRRNVKNASRCSVFVDDEFLAACPIDVALALGIRKGIEITPDLEQKLRKEDRRVVMRQKAYRFATYKPRTLHQVRVFLEAKELTPEEIDDVVSWLAEFRLIDDVTYVERFLSAAFERKPLSKLMARRMLLKKGVPDTVVSPALETWYSNEATEDVAFRAAEKKLRMLSTTAQSEREAKLIRFLQYRAYPWPTIKSVVARLRDVGLLIVVAMVASVAVQSQQDTCGRLRLSETVNQFQPTTMPVLDAFGTLYVDRKLHPDNRDGGLRDPDDVWFAQRTGKQAFAELRHSPIAAGVQPDVVFWVSADGLHALVVGQFDAAGLPSRTLALMSRDAPRGMFTRVSLLPIPGLADLGRNFYASMSEDRSTLLLALERDDSRGGLDIYVSQLCKGAWSAPRNLGPTINTAAFDGAPWLAPDGVTLYLASSGREDRYGKADLYVSRRLDSTWTSWSAPQNLGACINTIEDETAISLTPTLDSVLIHSWDQETGRPGIYIASLPPTMRPNPVITLSGRVVDVITRTPVSGATIKLTTGRCAEWTLQCDTAQGTFTTIVPSQTHAHFNAEAPQYVPSTSDLRIRSIDSSSTTTLTFVLFPEDRPIASMYFERGSAELELADSAWMTRIAEQIRNRTIDVIVLGYTDRVGSRETNNALSRQRAAAVARVLASAGVEQSAISIDGRGVESTSQSQSTEQPTSRRVDVFVRRQSGSKKR
jgi:outer membrane protein OmpA-like peptidoglycan-associated protein/SOS response regulatory protein OraA/RecX